MCFVWISEQTAQKTAITAITATTAKHTSVRSGSVTVKSHLVAGQKKIQRNSAVDKITHKAIATARILHESRVINGDRV